MQRVSWGTDRFGTGSMDLKRSAGSLKRRHLIGGMSAIALGSFATSLVPANAEPNGETSVHQDIAFKAAPSRVYDALTDEKQFSAFSGGSAVISKEIGGEFKLFGGLQGIKGVTGRNVELVPHERIVQAWRANHWPVGVYSIVRFKLAAEGPGTRISFDQAGFAPVPPTTAWAIMYWEPLRKYLGN
jgi:activator of HSP90 ATPase